MQPLDVSGFGPMKIQYREAVAAFALENPDLIINQARFAQIIMPIYYRVMCKENAIAGFRKCGLYPWNPDAPDYSKIAPRAAQRGHNSPHLVGVNISKKLYLSYSMC